MRRPAHVAVAQQGHRVVGDGAQNRVLKVDAGQLTAGQHHQVARVEVAVHDHLSLCQSALAQRLLKRGKRGCGAGVEGPLEQLRAEPFREQRHLRGQAPIVVAGQGKGPRIGQRELAQHSQRLRVVAIDRSFIQPGKQCLPAQVFKGKKATAQIGVINAGNAHPGLGQRPGDTQKLRVFLRCRRRIAEHGAELRAFGAIVAPQAAIAGDEAEPGGADIGRGFIPGAQDFTAIARRHTLYSVVG